MTTAIIVLLLVILVLLGLVGFMVNIALDDIYNAMYGIDHRLDTHAYLLDELNKRTYVIQTRMQNE